MDVSTDSLTTPLISEKSVYFQGYPILDSRFLSRSHNILLSGKKSYLQLYDINKGVSAKLTSSLMTRCFPKHIEKIAISPDETYIAVYGQTGDIVILDGQQKHFLFSFKTPHPVSKVQFDKEKLYAIASGNVYTYCLRTRKLLSCFHDSGSLNSTALAVSASRVATGSSSGMINIYSKPEHNLLKEFGNMTTQVDSLMFNPTGELLVGYSKWKNNALRIMHMDTQTVFMNFPSLESNLRKVT